MEIQIKIKTQEGFGGLINWCKKEGSERNSQREKKERERERLQDRKLERRDPNHARRWSPIETSFCWTPLMTLMAPSQTLAFCSRFKAIQTKRLDDTHPLLRV
jgi:hypothetical protein